MQCAEQGEALRRAERTAREGRAGPRLGALGALGAGGGARGSGRRGSGGGGSGGLRPGRPRTGLERPAAVQGGVRAQPPRPRPRRSRRWNARGVSLWPGAGRGGPPAAGPLNRPLRPPRPATNPASELATPDAGHHAAPPPGTAPAALAAAAAAAAVPRSPRCPGSAGPSGLPEAGDPWPGGQPGAPPRSGRPHRRALFGSWPARRGPRRRYGPLRQERGIGEGHSTGRTEGGRARQGWAGELASMCSLHPSLSIRGAGEGIPSQMNPVGKLRFSEGSQG